MNIRFKEKLPIYKVWETKDKIIDSADFFCVSMEAARFLKINKVW